MFTSITSHAGALVTAIVVLTGGATLHGGAAAADPNQDEQFLALLNKADIPALENAPSLIATAHTVCRKLDDGMPVDDLVDTMRNNAYNMTPIDRLFPRRVTSTMTRFITAAVEAYCPYDQSKIASIMANPAPGSNEPMHRVAASGVFVAGRYGDARSDRDAHGIVLASLIGAVPSGEITPPDPPQIPAPPPPTAQILPKHAPPPPKQAPPPPKQVPPPPQQAPPPPQQAEPPPQQSPPPPQQAEPPPQQAEPPAVAPQPGGAAGSGGNGGGGNGGGGTGGNGGSGTGGTGGNGPAEPSPTPPMPPGWVRLAP
jgi:uncharacterized membrane protein YgcG